MSTHHGTRSYSTAEVAKITGLAYRQLDDYVRSGLIRPSVREARGSGSQRRWSGDDVDVLSMIARLLAAGVSLRRIRQDGNPYETARAVAQTMTRVISSAPAPTVRGIS